METSTISAQILEIFPEIKTKCGANVTVNKLTLDLLSTLRSAPFQMTMKDGIRVGNIEDTVMKMDMQFDKCTHANAVMVNETLLSFNMSMEAMLNFTMQDTVFYLFGKRAWVKNVNMVENKINITTTQDLNMIFQSIMDAQVEEYNV